MAKRTLEQVVQEQLGGMGFLLCQKEMQVETLAEELENLKKELEALKKEKEKE